MTNKNKTKAAGFALAALACCGWMLGPYPLVVIIPLFILAKVHLFLLAPFLPTALFFVWNPGLLKGQTSVPIRSVILLAVLTALTTVYFVSSWSYGLQFQGAKYTYGICAANIVWLLVLWAIFIVVRRKASFNLNLLAHFLLFAWLGWFAFPWLGELV